jgi:hypothetical protein
MLSIDKIYNYPFNALYSATTLSIMTFGITALSIITFSVTTLSMTINKMQHSA